MISDTTFPEPKSELELLERARNLAGRSFSDLAEEIGITPPENLKRDKGWVGQLIERHLGAIAGSKPQQDFIDLGIELKTIPVSHSGQPLETTFVCVAPLTGVHGLTWDKCHVKNKLSKVLWVPVEGEREIPLSERKVGFALIWSPNAQENQLLQDDWEEHMDLIALGKVSDISAKLGQVMQIRPKAANSRIKTDAYGASGRRIKALPRGFYLRKSFTSAVLQRCLNEQILFND
jgi:DNA mismatch repair protein MutH